MDIVWLHVQGQIWDLIAQRLLEQGYWTRVIKRTAKPDLKELRNLKESHPLPDGIRKQCERFFDTLLGKSSLLLDMLYRKTDWKTDHYNNASFHELYYRIRIYFEFYAHILLKEKVTLVVFFDTPHMGWDYILYEVAVFLDIRTLILEQSRFPNKFFHFFDYMDYGTFETARILDEMEAYPIEKKVEKSWFYMKKNRGRTSQLSLKKLITPDKYKKRLSLFIERNDHLRFIRDVCQKDRRPQAFFRFSTERRYKKALKRNAARDYSLTCRFVYFPLHLQPEKNATAWGGVYLDQVLAVERLSQLIPKDWYIYIKENPRQKGAYRNSLFFERIRQIPNAMLIPQAADTFQLIKASQFVATVTGTVAYEAVSGGKNALLFGWGAWYQSLPGIYRYHDELDVDALVNTPIDHDLVQQGLARLLNKCGTGVIREEWMLPVEGFTFDQNTASVAQSLVRILYSPEQAPCIQAQETVLA